MRSASSFEDYLTQHPKWREGILMLQKAILDTGMKEAIKWGAPVYSFNNKNLVSIGAFNNHLALWFFHGSLLIDKEKLLLKVQDKTKHMRHLRYHDFKEINVNIVKSYCHESIQHLKDDKLEKNVRVKKQLIIPNELGQALDNSPALKDSYNALSLSKRREYADYISEAKQEKTKFNRLEKITLLILEGQGLNDKYK